MSRSNQKTPAEKVAKYLKYQRGKRGWTVSDLASNSGLTPSFLARLESGAYKDLSFGVLVRLAEGLKMGIDDLLIKSGLIKNHGHLPRLHHYLKEKYQFPEEAIKNVELVVELMGYKYEKEIDDLTKLHKRYWSKKNSDVFDKTKS